MLVLSRKKNEGLVIGAGTPYETHLVVVEIRGDKVRLGVEAPTDVSVNRIETLQLRTVATNRLEAVGPDGRLGKALHRFLELMDKLQGV